MKQKGAVLERRGIKREEYDPYTERILGNEKRIDNGRFCRRWKRFKNNEENILSINNFNSRRRLIGEASFLQLVN